MTTGSPIIDPGVSPPLALQGRVVTMDRARGGTILANGVVYSQGGQIIAVAPATAGRPPGFEAVAVVPTGGTIVPGLIELHNHLAYDVLGLWQVPKRFGNRDQWSGSSTPDYHRLITGPMQVLGSEPELVAAVVRWVELRCLLGGTTTSQGMTLATDPGIVQHYRGLVRNVEATGDPTLPAAATHIADVEASDRGKFLTRISGSTKMILHLAEGTDVAAHNHFAALQGPDGKWAITPNLISIHCVALGPADFAVLSEHGGSMVWSPFSNLLLYGQTANIGAAIAHDVPIVLGSDWSPSGSKNALGELKVARLAAHVAGTALTDEDLLAMVTVIPARLLGWANRLGSLVSGALADLVVVGTSSGSAHAAVIDATEADVSLVVINGIPRCGRPDLMAATGAPTTGETITVGGHPCLLNLAQPNADSAVAAVSAADAERLLSAALAGLPGRQHARRARVADGEVRLAVEGLVDNAMTPRHHLPFHRVPTGPNRRRQPAADASRQPLPSLPLDPLTAADNPAFYATVAAEINLCPPVRDGLLAYAPGRT